MMQIADRYTLTRQHVWRWEKKGVDPKFWLPTLAKALNLDLDLLRSASVNGGTGRRIQRTKRYTCTRPAS